MKNIIKINLFCFILIMGSGQLMAQDKMILRYKADTLTIKVFEIGTNEIKYKLWPVDENMPLMAESRDKIKKIIFANGTIMKFSSDEFSDANNYAEQRKTAIKLDPFSILLGMTSIAYEQSMKPGRSWEVGLGLIGLGSGIEDGSKYSGLLVRAGYKFINQPDYYMRGMRYTHILKGAYIRPEIVISYYNSEQMVTYYNYNPVTFSTIATKQTEKYRNTVYAFMLNFGKQFVFDDIFVVDAFAGLGIGAGNSTLVSNNSIPLNSYNDNYGGKRPFGILTTDNGELNIAGQAGLKVGILLGKKKAEKN